MGQAEGQPRALRAIGIRRLERVLHANPLKRVLHTDPGVLLAGVEILRIEHSAAHFGCAADDHRVPERDAGALMDADRAQHVISCRDVHVPVRQVGDDLLRRSPR